MPFSRTIRLPLINVVTSCRGPARKLLPSVIELIKTVNRSLKLGQLLCKCRSPDFLLEVIKKQVKLVKSFGCPICMEMCVVCFFVALLVSMVSAPW